MSSDAAALFNTLGALRSLPNMPSGVMECQQLLQADEPDMGVFVQSLRRIPLVAAEVLAAAKRLKEVRNPDDRSPISSIEHAVVYIGMKTTRDIIQLAALKTFKTNTKIFDLNQFWKESFFIGAIAEKLIPRIPTTKSRDEIYLAATLSNLGKIVSAIIFPNQLDAIAKDMKNPKTAAPWTILELSNDAYEHTLLGEIGAAFWGFPDFVLDACKHHHSWPYDQIMGSEVGFMEIIGLSNQIMHWSFLQPQRIDRDLLKNLCKAVGMSESAVEKLCEEELFPLKQDFDRLDSAAA